MRANGTATNSIHNSAADDVLQIRTNEPTAFVSKKSRASSFPFRNSSHPEDSDSDVLPYPKVQIDKKTRTQSTTKGYFILTSAEALSAKKQAIEEKARKEEVKVKRQEVRALKKKEREEA